VPGGAAIKDASRSYIHEEVWRYLFNHPVDKVGEAVAADSECWMELRKN